MWVLQGLGSGLLFFFGLVALALVLSTVTDISIWERWVLKGWLGNRVLKLPNDELFALERQNRARLWAWMIVVVAGLSAVAGLPWWAWGPVAVGGVCLLWIGYAPNSVNYQAWHMSNQRRGRCPWCGYELGQPEIQPCPECGRERVLK